MLDFYLQAMSRDGRVSDTIMRDLFGEQKEILGFENEIAVSQVAD